MPSTRVRRLPERGRYDRATLDAILDEGLVAHVGVVSPEGPVVVPMGYVRDGDRLLLHGSSASRTMRILASGAPACLTVTLLDGVVFARSAFHHSMNYRSVVAFGRATVIDGTEKAAVLDRFVEAMAVGRSKQARPASAKELAATMVVAFPLDAASAKVRAGPPGDEPEDLAWPAWSGVVPLTIAAGRPEQDPTQDPAPPPANLARWSPTRRG